MVSKTCYLRFTALLSWDLCTIDVSQIVYDTGTLLKKVSTGGIFANNCDCDISNPRCTEYIKYHWTDVGCSNMHWHQRTNDNSNGTRGLTSNGKQSRVNVEVETSDRENKECWLTRWRAASSPGPVSSRWGTCPHTGRPWPPPSSLSGCSGHVCRPHPAPSQTLMLSAGLGAGSCQQFNSTFNNLTGWHLTKCHLTRHFLTRHYSTKYHLTRRHFKRHHLRRHYLKR